MIRKLFFGLALAAGAGLTIGCEAAKDAGKDAKKATTDAAKGAADAAKGAADASKDAAKSAADAAKSAADATKAAADKAGDAAKVAMDKAKTEYLKPIEEMFPKVEEKIKGLTGDAGTKAAAAFVTIKDLIAKFKTSGVGEYAGMMGGITEKIAELKKMLGL